MSRIEAIDMNKFRRYGLRDMWAQMRVAYRHGISTRSVPFPQLDDKDFIMKEKLLKRPGEDRL